MEMGSSGLGGSIEAELATLGSQLDELTDRVTAAADRFAETPDSQIAADLFAAERALISARRSLDRARNTAPR